MEQEIKGLEYLMKNEIKNKKCNMDAPFAFISYSHDEHDSKIVMNVFKALYERNVNIWIDTANMPYNEEDWKKSATAALRNHKCKFAFFFRSESSMLKKTIAEELRMIRKLKHIDSIVTIDIWKDSQINAGKFHDKVLNDEQEGNYDICQAICESVNVDCKAIRLVSDMGNDIFQLVDEMYEEAKEKGIVLASKNGTDNKKDTTHSKVEASVKEKVVEPKEGKHITLSTTLKEFFTMCESPQVCLALREVREHGYAKKQFFDYMMAALLRGCDEKAFKSFKDNEQILIPAKWNYCTYAVSRNYDSENPKCGLSQFTWTSNARKAVGLAKSGMLGDNSVIFAGLSETETLGTIRQKFVEGKEAGFITKDNQQVLAAFDALLQIREVGK